MSKRRKVLVILGLIALVAGCFVTLRPRDEPKYQGHYLSEWLRQYSPEHIVTPAKIEAREAILAFGTNGLPYYVKLLQRKPTPWRKSLYEQLPKFLKATRWVDDWHMADAFQPYIDGLNGIRILGTNAVSAVPDLRAIMSDPTKPYAAIYAIEALGFIGEPAIPVLQAAFANPDQASRRAILSAIAFIAYGRNTNTCLPLIVQALNDQDDFVRYTASNAIRQLAPQFLPNVPSH